MGLSMWLLLYFCLFSVKIPLFSTTAAAGPALRLDDVLIAFLTPVLLTKAYRAGFFREGRPIVVAGLLFVVEGALSAVYAVAARGGDPLTAAAYAARPLEYSIFVLVGYMIGRRGGGKKLSWCLRAYSLYFAGLCVLQVAGVGIGASLFSFDRAAANTSGPYEAAAVGAFLIFFFAARREWTFVIPPVVGVLLTDSRITTVAVVVVALLAGGAARGPRRLPIRLLRAGTLGAASLVFVGLGVTAGLQGSPLEARFQQTHLTDSWDEASAIRAATPAARTPHEYETFAYSDLQALFERPDASSAIRFTRWQIALKAVLADPTALAIGLGPSFVGAALDGYYVRLVVEQGLAGVLLFVLLARRVWATARTYPGLRQYLAVLALTGGFIDIFASYRPMLLLWLSTGYAISLARTRVDAPRAIAAGAVATRSHGRAVTA